MTIFLTYVADMANQPSPSTFSPNNVKAEIPYLAMHTCTRYVHVYGITKQETNLEEIGVSGSSSNNH